MQRPVSPHGTQTTHKPIHCRVIITWPSEGHSDVLDAQPSDRFTAVEWLGRLVASAAACFKAKQSTEKHKSPPKFWHKYLQGRITKNTTYSHDHCDPWGEKYKENCLKAAYHCFFFFFFCCQCYLGGLTSRQQNVILLHIFFSAIRRERFGGSAWIHKKPVRSWESWSTHE